MRRSILSSVLAVLAGLVACAPDAPSDPRPLVVVSVLPHRQVVERIAGDLVRVEVLIPPGASPATYEPTLDQLAALDEAALYLKVGHRSFPFEAAWLDRMMAETDALPVVDGSDGIESRSGDPHVWLAPHQVERTATLVESALEEILPEHADALRANLAGFRGEIEGLDAEIRAILAGAERRSFLVFHPAWGHFAEAYGLRQVAIEHEGKEPGPHRLAELIEHARRDGVGVVFVQPQFDRASAEVVARELGARVETLDPLAPDWEANLRRAARALAEGAVP
jgi:zinc transport system substrate-binding protein